MSYRVIPIYFATADWMRFLYESYGMKFRNVSSYQVGDECFKDFKVGEVRVRVQKTAKTWTEDELEKVVKWIEEQETKKKERIRAENSRGLVRV